MLLSWATLHDKIQSMEFKFGIDSAGLSGIQCTDKIQCKDCPFSTINISCLTVRESYVRWCLKNYLMPQWFL